MPLSAAVKGLNTRCALVFLGKTPLWPCFLGSVWGALLVVNAITFPFDSWPYGTGTTDKPDLRVVQGFVTCTNQQECREYTQLSIVSQPVSWHEQSSAQSSADHKRSRTCNEHLRPRNKSRPRTCVGRSVLHGAARVCHMKIVRDFEQLTKTHKRHHL